MEAYLGEIILATVLVIVSFLLKSAITGKVDLISNKLDTVIKNQEEHKIELEKVKKDVHSNATWGKESKERIEKLVEDVNTLNRFMDSSKEKFTNLENKIKE